MAPSRTIALIAAPLLVAGSVAGFLVAGGSLSEGLGLEPATQDATAAEDGCSVPAAFSFPSEASVQEWTGEVPADADGGTIEASAWWGGVLVAPSDGDTYSVEIAEIDGRDELEPTVTADVTEGTFSLKAVVEHANEQEVGPATVSAGTNPDAEAHVKVRVPAKVYESIEADSAVNQGIWADDNGTEANVHLHPHTDTDLQDETPDESVLVKDLEAGTIAAEAYNRPAGAAGLVGGDVHVDSHNAQAGLADVDADGKVSASSYNAAACARAVEAGTLHVDSHNGPATAVDATADEITLDSYNMAAVGEDLRAAELSADSHNGPARLSLVPSDDGEAHADSYNEEAEITVATGQTYGYDAYADSYNGEATVDLPNAQSQADEDEEDRWDESAHAKTQGFEGRDIQFTLDASSHNGDASVLGR